MLLDDYTNMLWIPDDSKHAVVCIQLYQEAARFMWCLAIRKPFQKDIMLLKVIQSLQRVVICMKVERALASSVIFFKILQIFQKCSLINVTGQSRSHS
jgi:hypothetical protein